jgi:hypothetical protein
VDGYIRLAAILVAAIIAALCTFWLTSGLHIVVRVFVWCGFAVMVVVAVLAVLGWRDLWKPLE